MITALLLACTGTEADTDRDPPVVTDTVTDPTPTPTDTGTSPVTWPPLELCINEWMPENDATLTGDSGLTPDWIELHNPGADAVDLTGWSLTDDRDEPRRGPLSGVLDAGGFLLVEADGTTLPFALSAEGGEVGLYAPDGRGSLVTYGAVAADFSVARTPDCCSEAGCFSFVFRGTPGVSNVPEVLSDVTFFSLSNSWRFWDQGVVDAAWASSDFDDAAWTEGVAPLGYGDAQATMVSYGADPNQKFITTWFRAHFDVTVEGLRTATLQLKRDDGAVVYLDGVEVVRSNLPSGGLDANTLATLSVGDAEETQVFSFEIDPALLTPGPHVLAVEVHQSAADSSDLTFDAGVIGTLPSAP